MRITLKDIKKGIIKLAPTSSDDLWLLGQMINPGAFVSSKTTRKVKISETKVDKKIYYIKIRVEKLGYENDILRISGIVESEHDDIPKGSHHSINLGLNDEAKVEQKWLKFQIEKIEDATKEKSNILLVVLDRENVFFAEIHQAGYKILSNFEGDVEKKVEGIKAIGGFYAQVAKKLKEYDTRLQLDKIVLASPAFFKEDFMKQLVDDGLRKKIILATCSSASENAFNELMKRDELKKAFAEERMQHEINAVEELFVEIGMDGKSCYGFEQVKKKTDVGAVEKLLISSNLINEFREKEEFDKLEQIMLIVEQTNGKVMIIDSHNDAGKKLDGISGIGAVLRYKNY